MLYGVCLGGDFVLLLCPCILVVFCGVIVFSVLMRFVCVLRWCPYAMMMFSVLLYCFCVLAVLLRFFDVFILWQYFCALMVN